MQPTSETIAAKDEERHAAFGQERTHGYCYTMQREKPPLNRGTDRLVTGHTAGISS